VTLHDGITQTGRDFDLLELDDALDRLDAESTEDRQIVELKFFGGLTEPEIAVLLGVSERTIRRRWLFARTWLYRRLGEGTEASP
jgi:RNA polymerase sigma factor (sigma-70 family)